MRRLRSTVATVEGASESRRSSRVRWSASTLRAYPCSADASRAGSSVEMGSERASAPDCGDAAVTGSAAAPPRVLRSASAVSADDATATIASTQLGRAALIEIGERVLKVRRKVP